MHHIHFIILQHGYHGTSEDFQHLHGLLRHATSFAGEALPSVQSPDADWSIASNASRGPSSPLREPASGLSGSTSTSVTSLGAAPISPSDLKTVVLNLDVNDGWKTDNGVLRCAERLVEAVMQSVRAHLPAPPSDPAPEPHTSPDTRKANVAAGAAEPRQPLLTLHFSFVAHSMGGLMVRAALPALAEQLQSLTSTSEDGDPLAPLGSLAQRPMKIVWETFCCIAVPHVGVTHMPSQMRARMGKFTGHIFSRGLHDLFLCSPVVLDEITSAAHLKAWRRFHRRVLMNTMNDCTVMSYSSIFTIVPEEQTILYSQHKDLTPPVLAGDEVDAAKATTKATAAAASSARSAGSPLPIVRDSDHLPLPSTTREELMQGGWVLDAVTDDLWPPPLLPRERDIARLIVREVGPFEVHTSDFRPIYAELIACTALPGATATPATVIPEVAADPSREKALMAVARRGTEDWAHRALICKGEYVQLPSLFGFVGEYVANGLLGAAIDSAEAAITSTRPDPVAPAHGAAELLNTGARATA